MNKLFFILFFISLVSFSQKENHSSLQVEYLNGNILSHKKKISHLAISHPKGLILSWNHKSSPENKKLAAYNHPNWGVSFIYQDFNNPTLGKVYAAQINYSFYFGNKAKNNQFYLKLGQGIAYNTNPFDLETNNKNNAFGSHLLVNNSLGINYKRKKIFNAFDANIGLMISHYSNAAIKSPNVGLNVLSINTGISYNFDNQHPINYTASDKDSKNHYQKEPVKFNFQLSGGVNSSGNIGDKQFPFYVGTIYADKRLNRKSILQFGSEIFFSKFLKELIAYNSVAFPERNEDGKADYKRVSLLIGHELDIDNFSIITQLGYYIYYPYPYETRYYERVGVKKYFSKKWFAIASIKAHLFIAESINVGIGIRL